MAAILNSTILDFSSFWFKTLTQTWWLAICHQTWIHSHSSWWCQPSWILPSWSQTHCWTKKCSLIHCHSTLWLSLHLWILPSWIQILHKTLTQTNSFSLNLVMPDILIAVIMDSTSLGFKKKTSLIYSDSNFIMAAILNSTILDSQLFCTKTVHSYILTQVDYCSHLEFCLCWIQILSSWIQTPCCLLSDSLKNTLTPPWLKPIQFDSNSFILT